MKKRYFFLLWMGGFGPLALQESTASATAQDSFQRLLYVACPGIRNYLEYGGHGLLVFDIDNGHRFLRRIPMGGLDENGKPMNVKGICASAVTKRLYVSTIKTLMCFDLLTDKMLWEKAYEGGCDRMAISPDGKTLYLPSYEKEHWHVIDALTGDVTTQVVPKSGAHNTVYGPDGKRAYLAGLRSSFLSVADAASHTLLKQVGPFSESIRPFTINGSQTLCFVNVNDLLGFEVGDLNTGQKLYRVEVPGCQKAPPKRHGRAVSHGIALTPDEREIWVTDAPNSHLHIFDAGVMPPAHLTSIQLRDQPGWITFSIDGTLAYPSTGDVIDIRTRKIVAALKDENGVDVQSEKMVEVDFQGSEPIGAGDQFGVGRVTSPAGKSP